MRYKINIMIKICTYFIILRLYIHDLRLDLPLIRAISSVQSHCNFTLGPERAVQYLSSIYFPMLIILSSPVIILLFCIVIVRETAKS